MHFLYVCMYVCTSYSKTSVCIFEYFSLCGNFKMKQKGKIPHKSLAKNGVSRAGLIEATGLQQSWQRGAAVTAGLAPATAQLTVPRSLHPKADRGALRWCQRGCSLGRGPTVWCGHRPRSLSGPPPAPLVQSHCEAAPSPSPHNSFAPYFRSD